MARNLMVLALVVLLAIGGYALWKQHASSSSFGNGEVVSHDNLATSEKDAMNSGATNVDGQPGEEVHPTPSRSDAPGTVNTEPAGASGSTAAQSMAAPAGPTQTYSLAGPGNAPPVTDSIAPNPPNGEVFTGTGKFQWYRQGNLTWRVNSSTGNACIAFATMEEWAKPIVMSHGCGNG